MTYKNTHYSLNQVRLKWFMEIEKQEDVFLRSV